MKMVADRITFVVHVRTIDENGNPVGESQLLMPGQPPQPWTLYTHQFDQLAERVDALVAEAAAEAQGT